MTHNIPEVLPGHWATPDGFEMAKYCAALKRCELPAQNVTDFAVANDAYLRPNVMNLTVAKVRLRWVSTQLALANMDKAELLDGARELLAYAERAMVNIQGERAAPWNLQEMDERGLTDEEILKMRALIERLSK